MSEAPHPKLAELLAFWQDARPGEGAVPIRARFDAFALRPWLGHLSLYDMTTGAEDLVIRLDGTEVVAMCGEDWTGRLVSDVDKRFGSRLLDRCLEVVRTREPSLDGSTVLFQKQWVAVQSLLLPVGRLPDQPDRVINALYPDLGQEELLL